MDKDKKEYQAVVAILVGQGTYSATTTKAAKIYSQTEDQKLKAALGALIKAIADGKGSHRPLGGIPKFQPLMTYCENMIQSETPQWQTLAARNGWGPKA